MANVYNLKGTSHSFFQIGKGGGRIAQGANTNIINVEAQQRFDVVLDNDIVISTTNTGLDAFTILSSGNNPATHELRFAEVATNGTNYVGFKSPASLSTSWMWTLPNSDGPAGSALTTNGAGVLGWAAVNFLPYEALGSGGFAINNTEQIVDFLAERASNPDYTLDGSGGIRVNSDGTYTIEYCIAADGTNGTRASVRARLYIDGVLYSHSQAYSYHRTVAAGEGTATRKVTINLSAGQIVDVRVRTVGGNGVSLISDQSNIVFERKV